MRWSCEGCTRSYDCIDRPARTGDAGSTLPASKVFLTQLGFKLLGLPELNDPAIGATDQGGCGKDAVEREHGASERVMEAKMESEFRSSKT